MAIKDKRHILTDIKLTTEVRRPVIELSKEQKDKIKTVAGAALGVIAAAGIITVTAAAPNIFQAVDKIYKMVKKKKYSFDEKQKKTAHAFYYLKRHDYIEIVTKKNCVWARLTEKGKQKVEELNLDTLRVKQEKKWDGKWWLVAADIPTKEYRQAADLLRRKIKQMQFYPLQRTLWFYPYNPVPEIEFLSQHFGIAKFVTVMEVSRMDKDDEKKLKKFFSV